VSENPGLPPLIPREVLFGNPERTSPALSPDGARIGFVAPVDGVLNVWVGPADGSRAPVPVTADTDRGIRIWMFCHDDRHLVFGQDTAGDENWRLYLMDRDGGEPRLLTPGDGVQAQLLAHNRWHPDEVLVGLNADNPQLHDVHRLRLSTGELTKEVTNPGFAGWLIDSDLAVRGAYAMQPDGALDILLRDDAAAGTDAEWAPFLHVPPDDVLGTGVVSFSRDGRSVLLESSIDANAARLLRVDLATGEQQVIVADEEYDVSGVWLHPETLEPQAVVLTRERQEVQLLDGALAGDLERLRALGDGELGVSRSERSDTRWLVSMAPSDGPVAYYTYDRSDGSTTFLFHHQQALLGYELAAMEPFSFTARDGLRVHGYLTFPPGLPREGLPAILNVHGGPWVRDTWGYRPEAQWMANRGYLCVQVNYRGSTGYGKAFTNAGDRQWGAAMHDDLVDAVEHVVGQGWVDRDRVGIYGGSYGGYAALVGATFTPEVFRCAVDIVGPSNLITLIETVPEYWKPQIAIFHRRVGDPSADREFLWSRSPLSRVGDIRVPLLIAQGANDPRVKQAEAEQIVAALVEKGLPHEYLLFADEGHGFAKPQSRERFYAAAEPFLAEHLGGRSAEPEPAGTASGAVAQGPA
jgi:dipeptidyl aminopeptidase/acylaminoacyl peptidase